MYKNGINELFYYINESQLVEIDSQNTDFMKLRDTLYSKSQSQKFSIAVADSIYLHYSFAQAYLG